MLHLTLHPSLLPPSSLPGLALTARPVIICLQHSSFSPLAHILGVCVEREVASIAAGGEGGKGAGKESKETISQGGGGGGGGGPDF